MGGADRIVFTDGAAAELGCAHVQLNIGIRNGQYAGAKQILCPDCGQWVDVPGRVGETVKLDKSEEGDNQK